MSGGGSDFSLHLLATELVKRGYDVTVATMNTYSENDINSEICYNLIEEGYQPSKNQFQKAQSIIQKMNSLNDQTDIFHIFSPIYIAPAGYFAMKSETPVIARLNTYTFFCTNLGEMDGECHKNCTSSRKFHHDTADLSSRLLKLPQYIFETNLQHKLANNISEFFALSPQIKNIYSHIGIKEEKISVIPNWQDPEFKSTTTSSTNFEEINILYVGRLVEEKGVDILIKAMKNLKLDDKDYTLDIVGTGPISDRLLDYTDEYNLNNCINFHGHVGYQSLSSYYSEADLFVHPSRWPEPFGRTLLEAMQHSLPTVVSNIGAPKWVVGGSGKSFQRGSPDSLSNTIQSITQNRKLYRQMQNKTTDELQRFTQERVMSQIENRYSAVYSNT